MTITAIHIEGNLIAPDMTPDISAGEIKGQTSLDFGLEKSVKLEDEIAFAWGEAKDQWRIFQRRLERIKHTDTATSETREYWAVPLLKLLGYDPSYQAKAEIIEGQTFAISHRTNPAYQPFFEININQDNSLSPLKLIENTPSENQNSDIHSAPPIHIIGSRLSLDKKPPSGMPRLSAHALLQEYLNKTDHLWGIVTNGLCWRLLRDCSLMTRLTYIEFDLEQILNGENFAEFGLFYRLFHRSRLPETIENVDSCLLEFYHQEALQQGGRVRDRLRDGVEDALKLLGNGFLQHPANHRLRESLNPNSNFNLSRENPDFTLEKGNKLTEKDFYRQLLLLIYRLLFLMVAESRNLLLAGEDEEKSRIYNEYYSINRLRVFAERIPSFLRGARGERREDFQDIWQGLRVTFSLFDESWRGELLGLSPLNGDLFGSNTLTILNNCAIDNHDLLLALRNLSLYENKGLLRRVNYTALDVEELGSVYESLLDFTPKVTILDGIYYFRLVTGSDRKTTGSYYTPPELVGQLIKSALEPVIADKLAQFGGSSSILLANTKQGSETLPLLTLKQAQEQALLSITVCDPACGSGHFLLAAARRIGKELARIRTEEMSPTPEAIRIAIRDVIQNCIYGVDLNPLAVDLCKVALWMEGFCKGFPLNFLDHRIKCGNSLVGVLDISVLDEGIPDNAFNGVTGDDKGLATQFKKRNKQEREQKGQLSLFDSLETDRSEYADTWRELGNIPETNTDDVKRKQREYQHRHSEENQGWWRDYSACNLWTAAFFMPLTEHNLQLLPTSAALQRLLSGVGNQESGVGVRELVQAANQLAQEKGFFHWCLEFPEVFAEGGFACVLGNPPWERIKLQEKEFFASKDESIANAKNKAERTKLIKQLAENNPQLLQSFEDAKHDADAQSKFIRESSRFPLTAVGDINTYAVFAETVRNLINSEGRVGVIVPTGIATDATTSKFFRDLVETSTLQGIKGFENERFLFPGIDHRVSFCIIFMGGINSQFQEMSFSWFAWNINQANEINRQVILTKDDFSRINPNTFNCPVFRTNPDAEITKKIYQRVPVLENEATKSNPWGISFMAMFHMANDSHLFKDEAGKGLLPLYEAKMFYNFDHRYSTYENATQAELNVGILPKPEVEKKQDPNFAVIPRYWVDKIEVENRLSNWDRNWLLALRSITFAKNERTAIFSLLPKIALGNSAPLIILEVNQEKLASCLVANLSSLVFDFVTRQKVGGNNFNFFIVKQLPIIPPDWYTEEDIKYISSRVLELVYTAYDMKPFAEDMGYEGEPFIWNEQRRAIIRAELDAKYAKLYGLTRDELRYILDPADIYGADFPSETFRVLKNNEIKKYGEYRTQRLVLAAWDTEISTLDILKESGLIGCISAESDLSTNYKSILKEGLDTKYDNR